MVVTGSIASSAATNAGLTAASIAIFGFLVHAGPALKGAPEVRVRWATTVGGLAGFVVALLVIVLSAYIG
jgi:hypothetical protein